MAEPFLGQIQTFGFNFAPRGWAFCNGQLLPISQNSALFSLLGATFGGDGRTTFGLPDLRGRTPIGFGRGPGLSEIEIGEKGGSNSHTLTIDQMPAHRHDIVVNSESADQDDPSGNYLAKTATATYSDSENGNTLNKEGAMTSNGSGQSFSIQNPLLGIYFSIALQGVFPSRN
ncbi:MAG: microcystin-dependent protein [Planctomycetaceae bacterium]|jgi:microcystin-dependent protein